MVRLPLFILFCLTISAGCSQNSAQDSGREPSKDSVRDPGKGTKVSGYVITDKAKRLLDRVPIKAHHLMTERLNGTLVQAEYVGVERGGPNFHDSHIWNGFFIGKDPGPKSKGIQMRSFTVHTMINYDGVFSDETKEASQAEIQLLKQRGYIE